MLNTIPHGPILELQLARPPANALNPELIRTLTKAIATAPNNGAEAIILSGAQGMYSGGLDVPELITLDRPSIKQVWREFFGMLETIATSSVPVVSAITGHSPAGGAVMAIYTDHRIMAEGDFRIGLNEVQVGLPVPDVIYLALRYIVGARQAEALGVFGSLITPDHALRVGLIDEVVPMGEVVPRARTWCEKFLKRPALARNQTRELARRDVVAAFDTFGEDQLDPWVDVWFSDETQNSMKALLKRLGQA